MGPNYNGFINDALVVKNALQSRTNLGLGTIATQSAANVTITGGTIDAVAITNGTIASAAITLGTINNTVIGGSTPAAATFTTVLANTGFQTATGGYIRSGAAAGSSTLLFRADSIAGGGYITMGTLSSGAVASLAFTQPSGSALTWDGGTIGGTTPAPGSFTTLSVSTSMNAAFLTSSSVVATDGSKNFSSLTYGSTVSNNSIVRRDGSGGIAGNLYTGTGATFSPGGTVSAPTATTTLNAVTSTTFRANIVLSGTAYAGNTSTDGIALGLNYNAGGNRQFSIADSAALSSSATQAQVRIIPLGASAGAAVEAVGMNGSTGLPLLLNPYANGPITTGTGLFTQNGTLIKPNQPCFLVHQTSSLTGLTKGADFTLTWNQEVFDQNNNFSSNTFTAPVTGRYLFNISAITLLNFNSATRFFAKLVTSNRSYALFNYNPTALSPSDNLPCFGSSIIADMDAADTATIVVYCSGGTSTFAINGDQESPFWSGYLLA